MPTAAQLETLYRVSSQLTYYDASAYTSAYTSYLS